MKLTSVIRLTSKLAYLLSGIGLSVGVQIGFAGVGINEIFLILSATLLLFYLPPDGWRRVSIFYRHHQVMILMMIFLMIFVSAGYLVGTIYATDYRAVFQLIRFFVFLVIIFQLPLFYTISGIGVPEDILRFMLIGVFISSIVNWLIFFGSGHPDLFLPGQNAIGQQVALFFPLLVYLFSCEKRLFITIIVFGVIVFFIATSLFSWSKGSWLVILNSIAFYLLFSSRRDLGGNLLIACLLIVIFLIYSEDLLRIIDTEISASDGSGSNEQRIASFWSGIYIARDFPFGAGAAYEILAGRYVEEAGLLWIQPDPHNTLSHIASVGGFGALVSYCLLHCAAFYALFRARGINRRLRLTIVTMLINGVLLMQFSGEFFTQAFWWLVLGTIFTLANSTGHHKNSAFSHQMPRKSNIVRSGLN